jgi:predicted CXXCH cytochrome family protein
MRKSYLFCAIILLITNSMIIGQSISNTVHNLSVSGPGSLKATSESEICVFCHTPHNSSPKAPLWNRTDPGLNYTLYNSSTLNANPGQPDGSSILCLSCHDGTIALGNVLSRSSAITFGGGETTLPSGSSNLSRDISDDHPISFTYNSTLASSDGELTDPNTLTGSVHLENGKLQCISCHDPHLNIYGDFLVANRQNSTLCIYCHDKNGWNISSHRTSTKVWNGSGLDPWPNSGYTTVSQNACENCHTPHNAGGSKRLANYSNDEDNCLNCHNGNVASEDIQSQLNKSYSHEVYNYSNLHDPTENSIVSTMHVECIDCHNPHYASNSTASAPNANGYISGIKGVNTDGTSVSEIQYEYELCYRCHADSPSKPGSTITRDIEQNNTRLEFDVSNPSFHPIEGPGPNNYVPSLISPYTESSIIYCTDCHSSDGAASPDGPHGSIYPQILKYNYSTIYGTPESYQSYELCYQCHERDKIINGSGKPFYNKVHMRHIVIASIPCTYCHDAHGISASQGNSTNNSNLINFDLSEATPYNEKLEFIDTGDRTGTCELVCHGREHDDPTQQHRY